MPAGLAPPSDDLSWDHQLTAPLGTPAPCSLSWLQHLFIDDCIQRGLPPTCFSVLGPHGRIEAQHMTLADAACTDATASAGIGLLLQAARMGLARELQVTQLPPR